MTSNKAAFSATVRCKENKRDGSAGKAVEGLIPFNSPSVDMWGMTEYITPTAFSDTLASGREVRALWCHDDYRLLGNTKNGTLVLEERAEGLYCELSLPETTYANDLYALIERGDVSTMSFGFYPVTVNDTPQPDGSVKRELVSVDLSEVSFGVSTPAYEETTSKTREADTNKGMETRKSKVIILRSLDIERLAELMEKEALEKEEVDFLLKAAEDIRAYAESKNASDEASGEEESPGDPGQESASADEAEARERLALILDMEEREEQ